MTTHIVISREELAELLVAAYKNGRGAGTIRYAADNLDSDYLKYANTLPSGLLPIADAPKDGTWVLVAGPSTCWSPTWTIIQARFSHGNWIDINTNAFYGGPGLYSPTHFCPLVTPE